MPPTPSCWPEIQGGLFRIPIEATVADLPWPSLWSHAILHVSTNASDTNVPNLNILLLARAFWQILEIPIFQMSIFQFSIFNFAHINKCFRYKCSKLEYFAFSTCNFANSWDTKISNVNISLWSHAILHISTNASDKNVPNLNILLLANAILQMLEITIFQMTIFHFDYIQFCTYQQMLQLQMFQT